MTHSDPVQQEYSQLAATYDRRWSFYIEATLRETLQRVVIQPQDRVLDLGCGTGSLLGRLYDRFPETSLVGLDPSAEMLSVARQKLPASVDFRLGNADGIPFEHESFDVLISTNAFHYFRHPSQAIQEMIRVLKPQGSLIITDWCHDYLTCRICDLFLRRFNQAHFRTYGVDDCHMLLETETLDQILVERYKINWLWGMMTATAIKKTA